MLLRVNLIWQKKKKKRLLDLVAYEDYVNFLLNNGSDFSELEEKSVEEYGLLRNEYTGRSLPESTIGEREVVFHKVEQLMKQADEKVDNNGGWYTDDKSKKGKIIKLGLEILKEHLTINEDCEENMRIRDQIVFLVNSLLKYSEPYKELKNFEKKLKSEDYIMDDFYYDIGSLLSRRKEMDVNITQKDKNRIIAEREKIDLHIQVND